MPVASCSVFIFLKNIARVCPLLKLSLLGNCSSYHCLSEELAVEADSTPINPRLSLSVLHQVLICPAELLRANNVVSLLVKLCYKQKSIERRYDCWECGGHAKNGPPAASGE